MFVGTGSYTGESIAQMANRHGIGPLVQEKRERVPYTRILSLLSKSQGNMIIGTTEPHYTASKTFQNILSGRPVFAMLHRESSAVQILSDAHADQYLVRYQGILDSAFREAVKKTWADFVDQGLTWQPEISQLEKYHARVSAGKLVQTIDKILDS